MAEACLTFILIRLLSVQVSRMYSSDNKISLFLSFDICDETNCSVFVSLC